VQKGGAAATQQGGPFDARTGCLKILSLASLGMLIELCSTSGRSNQKQAA